MGINGDRHLALISVHGDPAIDIGKEEAGGQNVYVRQVGESLAKLGWQIDMFTRQTNSNQSSIVEHSCNCRTIRLAAGPKDFVPRDNIFDYLPEFVYELTKFQQRSGFRYGLVHTNYWLSSWVGMELKRRQPSLQQVHTYHSLGAVKYSNVDHIPAIANTRLDIEKRCLETAEKIIATSPQEQEHMQTLVSTKGNIDTIPCGTDIQRFGSIRQDEARALLGIDSDAKVIFYIGRFDPRKGIETLVRAMGQSTLRDDTAPLHLIIGGGSRPGQSDGLERQRIESIVAELDLHAITHFPGRISDETLPAYYAASDVCVVPSHYEPFGLVAIEAMASGTPVVASDVGGLQFTVESGKTGLLAPPRDEAAFAAAIDQILANPEWRNQLGQAARKRVEARFSWHGVATQLDDLYSELIESSYATSLKSSVA
ncbi:MAG: glycosyltransferase family 1 protein [Elainellaceae cyanobacterium]